MMRMVMLEKLLPPIGLASNRPMPSPTTPQTKPTSGATVRPGIPPNKKADPAKKASAQAGISG